MDRFITTATLLIFVLLFSNSHASDKNVPINQYQWFGSHNSYKRPLPNDVFTFLSAHNPQKARQLNYAHPPLQTQLNQGLRQLEIDVVNDPEGNQYQTMELATRFGKQWLTKAEIDALQKPGFKVMHIPHVDALSHCVTLEQCLSELVAWSQANPNHFPVVILVNAKENQPDFLVSPKPAAFLVPTYIQLDSAFKRYLGERLITPDHIRGEFSTLKEAILTQGWPSEAQLSGKFIALFDGNNKQVERYTQGNFSLRHRAMFASLPENSDDAVMFIRNNPELHFEDIQKLVKQGFLVRTRADANLSASPLEKAKQRDFAIHSGAQMISTDYYPASPQAALSDYYASFDNGALRRRVPQQLNQ